MLARPAVEDPDVGGAVRDLALAERHLGRPLEDIGDEVPVRRDGGLRGRDRHHVPLAPAHGGNRQDRAQRREGEAVEEVRVHRRDAARREEDVRPSGVKASGTSASSL
jgi:hypothetical protein